jgi:LysR family transcriptional regulator, mexEF-oprN operon transcriptional activator
MTNNFNLDDVRGLDLNLLVVFASVVRHGSVKRAADDLRLGSSAVSMALSRLRLVVGDQLFVRTRAGVEPTEVALEMYRRVVPGLEQIAGAVRPRGSFDPHASDRRFRVGLSDDLEATVLPALLERVRSQGPKLSVVVRGVDYKTATARLEDGYVDVVLGAHPTDGAARYCALTVYEEDFVVVASARLNLPAQLDLETYLGLQHCLVSASGQPWGIVDTVLAAIGAARNVTITLERFLAVPFILERTGAAVTMPRRAATMLSEQLRLDLRELPFPSPKFPVGLSWHKRTDSDSGHHWFRTQVCETIAQMNERRDAAGVRS